MTHSVLHLVGYEHDNDADYELMLREEERILKLVRVRASCALACVITRARAH